MAHDEKAIESVQKNIPLIRNNLLLLMSNRNYQTMMSREGKEKLRARSARRSSRRAKEGRRSRRGRRAVHQLRGAVMEENQARISNEEVAALLEKNERDAAATVRPYDFAAQRINRTQLPLLEEISKNFGDRCRRLIGRIAGARRQPAFRFAGIGEERRSAGFVAGACDDRGRAPQALARICLRQRRTGAAADVVGWLLRRFGPCQRRSASR